MTSSIAPSLSSRAQGLFLGLASGNALGLPWENIWPKQEIAKLSGGTIREIAATERDLPWDDDLAQAVILAQALIEKGELELEDLGQRLLAWMKENGRGIGNLTQRVLEDIAQGTPVAEASAYAQESLGRNWSAGNGAVMRCAPLAIALWNDREELVKQTVLSAQVTHWNPLCVWSAVAFNLALAGAFAGKPLDCIALADELQAFGAPSAVSDAINGAKAPLERFQLDGKTKGFTLKAMQVGLWALRVHGNTEDILETLILEGGDTDTNGAIAGAALGARFGVESLPERWISSLARPDEIRALADALLARAKV